MKIHTILLSVICGAASLLSIPHAFAWGQKGHDVTAAIAERHLTPATKAAVDSLLGGMSIVYWSNWLDNASHTPDYAFTKTWHYVNVDKGQVYESRYINPDGDVVQAIRSCIAGLSDAETTPANRDLALKVLVHVVGDMHQPMHAGRATDLGGNRVKVKFFNDEKNLHSVWDGSLPEAVHRWSFSEWADQIDRASIPEQAVITSGNIDDWAKQSIAIASDIYDYFPEGRNISYNDIARWGETVDQQFLRGGLRLAHILNLIYDPSYKPATLIQSAKDL